MSTYNKHLTIEQREQIQSMLDAAHTFRQIAHTLGKDPTTISKEVRKKRIKVTTQSPGRYANTCIHTSSCAKSGMCPNQTCKRKSCKNCGRCNGWGICTDYVEYICPRLSKPPYVCNGCQSRISCRLYKQIYRASAAQKQYEFTLSDARQGFNVSENELEYINEIIQPLLKQGHSFHHICVNNTDKLQVSERTLYNLVEANALLVKNIDLPRKVRYRERKKAKERSIDSARRIGRTWDDLQAYLSTHPDEHIVQMDTVEGRKGGKVFLTMYFPAVSYLIIFLRERNTSQSVIDCFDYLYDLLGHELFSKLFKTIVTDNGTEFSNPKALEYSKDGKKRAAIYYCDPSRPDQKGALERGHEFIRMVLPKGSSFDHLTQENINTLMNHINSYSRSKLGDKSPHESFKFFFGDELLRKMNAIAIAPNNIILKQTLLKNH